MNVGCVPKKVVELFIRCLLYSFVSKVMFNTAVHAEFIRDHKDYCFEFQNDSYSFNWKYAINIPPTECNVATLLIYLVH